MCYSLELELRFRKFFYPQAYLYFLSGRVCLISNCEESCYSLKEFVTVKITEDNEIYELMSQGEGRNVVNAF